MSNGPEASWGRGEGGRFEDARVITAFLVLRAGSPRDRYASSSASDSLAPVSQGHGTNTNATGVVNRVDSIPWNVHHGLTRQPKSTHALFLEPGATQAHGQCLQNPRPSRGLIAVLVPPHKAPPETQPRLGATYVPHDEAFVTVGGLLTIAPHSTESTSMITPVPSPPRSSARLAPPPMTAPPSPTADGEALERVADEAEPGDFAGSLAFPPATLDTFLPTWLFAAQDNTNRARMDSIGRADFFVTPCPTRGLSYRLTRDARDTSRGISLAPGLATIPSGNACFSARSSEEPPVPPRNANPADF